MQSAAGNVPAQQQAVAGSGLADDIYVYCADKENAVMNIYSRSSGNVKKMKVVVKPLPHNFSIVQVGAIPRVYLIGGGTWDTRSESPPEMYWCRQFTANNQTNTLEFSIKAPMQYPRHGHSSCAFGDNHIVVSGSRKDARDACRRVEVYTISTNSW